MGRSVCDIFFFFFEKNMILHTNEIPVFFKKLNNFYIQNLKLKIYYEIVDFSSYMIFFFFLKSTKSTIS